VAEEAGALGAEERAFFETNGFVRLRGVFSPAEVAELSEELDEVITRFVVPDSGWSGPWRDRYLTPEQNAKAKLAATHELQQLAPSWGRALLNRKLTSAVAALIGPEVEFHHMTLHAKGPEFGTPFPLHQDWPFYEHQDGRYIDAIVHVDASTSENGCLRFLKGSHKLGPLTHRHEGSPHLPPEEYAFEDSVECPADRGDVVLFSIYTVHGSALNRTPNWRRVVRIGYRNPHNLQVGGQAMGRPGLMVHGIRPKIDGVTIDPYGPMKIAAPARG
jgi:hypothetical protein